jgi:anti-anti-sigma factor
MGEETEARDLADAEASGVEASVLAKGEIDMATAPELDRRLQAAISTRPARIVVDLSAVTFLDSSGINALVRAKNVGDGFGVDLVLESPNEACQRVLKVTGLDVVFDIRL